ncbi:hypothetical protein [Clostridium sp. HBUAS56010]|uniref:hypothetical protein n=1 Tax=Clostridium sp. HBUAS56010 TaxID=2571127 RepID=UPI0011788C33|nr:hypothetical protein [Clostridium sp. HBUAS56010]
MQNYMVIDDKTLQTPFGILGGVASFTCHPKGELFGVKLSEKNMIVTEVGELVPAYTETPRRKNKLAVEFDRKGMVVAVSLEQQQEIITPIGGLPAELVRFYPGGELHRIFMVDGQLSGFWSEEDERKHNIPLSFDLGICQFKAMISGICFYESGEIKSITLFPGEKIAVKTPLGTVETEVGLSLWQSGKLKSVEPMEAVMVPTPIGTLAAFDPDHNGINADSNSLSFTQEGEIKSLITCDHSIYVQTEEGSIVKYTPEQKMHPLYDDVLTVSGLKVEFDYNSRQVTMGGQSYCLNRCGFTIEAFQRPGMHCSPSDCANCSLCNKG